MEPNAFTTVPRKRRKKTNLDSDKPIVVSSDLGQSETSEKSVIDNGICLELLEDSTNPKTDLVLAPISLNDSKDVGALGCASVFLTEDIIPGVDSEISSVHVEMKTQLTLESEIPFSFMATASIVEPNINHYDLLEMDGDEGYVYDSSMVYCQCSRCSTLAEPYLADDTQCCLNCNKTAMANKCISEFGFLCKFCPSEDACSCNLCGLEPVKFAKLKNGKCSKCKDNAISSLCQKRKGICSHCISLSATGSEIKKVVKGLESKVLVQKPLNFNEHYKLQKGNSGASIKGSVPKSSKKHVSAGSLSSSSSDIDTTLLSISTSLTRISNCSTIGFDGRASDTTFFLGTFFNLPLPVVATISEGSW